jgi:signal peptidase II
MHDMQTEGRTPIASSRAIRARRLFIIIATSIFALDLLTKNWAENVLQFRAPISVLGEYLQFTYTTNSGAAFNLLEGGTYLLSSLKLIVAAFIIFSMAKVVSVSWGVTLALVFGGVTGNLFDRAVREPGLWRGEVVDWISIPNWPVFNVADSAIVIAAFLMAYLVVRDVSPTERPKDGS